MTAGEWMVWRELRGRTLGVRFRREDPVGPYIADFSCRALRLVIEVDGKTHGRYLDKDAARDRWMTNRGWTVIRLPDEWVKEDLASAIDVVAEAVEILQRGGDVPWRCTGVDDPPGWVG